MVRRRDGSGSRRAAIDADRRAGGKPHDGYDEKTLFKNTSLQIDRGERVAIIGPNGCGKSTLMRLMQQKEKPRAGTAMMGDNAQCKVNYFYQNQAEGLDTEKGVLQTLVEAAPDEGLNDPRPRRQVQHELPQQTRQVPVRR